MKVNKNTSFFKILASLVGIASVSALISVPAFALTNLTRSTTGTINSQVPPTDGETETPPVGTDTPPVDTDTPPVDTDTPPVDTDTPPGEPVPGQ
ncbi:MULTISPECIES: hypothetical protein [unclassified Nodularia (in: cyanobacteria)]|uniref:hypothetical protein n=1 Tax=unclassified Nodularia (in: cyanobacteria) TaxID=2656917 RepID=UPI00187F66E8|nr:MULTISPECIES: hypothetical protein [unclassified Nodularia (in: cyanobacteria)]MBE9200573.1 hypothetical protein [Nodularia sp. LEGE 06071]MCC2692523.1 hypothetical protein [Nodularia sp. LEGE 04288]